MSCQKPHDVGISNGHVHQSEEPQTLDLDQVLVIFGGHVLMEYVLVGDHFLVGFDYLVVVDFLVVYFLVEVLVVLQVEQSQSLVVDRSFCGFSGCGYVVGI
ncbi:hypothetical protein QL285_026996 [Trifolium repens]|nr:hypothetical protein QL285_026996 [Trifolium repens]